MANGWGGRRNGSGRKPPGSNVIPMKPKKDQRPRPMFSDESVMAIVEAIREQKLRARYRPRTAEWNPYIIRPDRFGPVVAHLNKHRRSLAMDQNGSLTDQNMFAVQAWQAGGMMGNDAAEGLLFLGYPFLSEMAQRAEFRLFGEIMSEEMTRKFIDFRGTDDESTKEKDKEKDKDAEEQATPDAAEDKMPPEFRPKQMMPTEANPSALTPEPPEKDGAEQKKPRSDDRNKEIERKIIELRHMADDLKLRHVFKQVAAQDSYFGIAHLFLDLKGANVEDPRDPENRMSIGNGRDEISKAKLGRNCLKGLRTIEPVWCYPTMYNAMNPLHPSWYDPEVWYVMGAEIHKTRLIPFVGRPVPDILKPAYAFGGLPMIQMAQPYVDIWLRTRESVAELIHAFSIMILQTNMGTTIQPGGSGGGAGDVIARMQLMNGLRDNAGMMIIDKATEDLKNVSAPLGTLDHLQAQAQEHMYSVARIPAVKWTGIQPTGLNATSEGELRAFNDTVHGYQEQLFRVGLTTIIDIMMISLWGARDPDIVFDFNELHEMTEKEKAESAKIKAETDQIRVDSGIVSQEEVRAVLVADPDSGYHGLDPEDVPELLQEEEAGLIPEGAGKGLEAELAQGGGGAAGGPQPPKPPFNAPAKPKRAPPFGKGGADQAMDAAMGMAEVRSAWEAAKQADQMGYLDGLARMDIVPDYDQWHSAYLDDKDTIEVQRKLLEDDDAEKTRTLLHEAGHRAQYKVDRAAFRAFQKAGLDTTENFVAMANAVHLHDFRCKGYVDDRVGEVFSESYAHWCLGMEMPIGLREFWEGRSSPGGLAQDAGWNESDHPRRNDGKFGSGGGGEGEKGESSKKLPMTKKGIAGSTMYRGQTREGQNPNGTYLASKDWASSYGKVRAFKIDDNAKVLDLDDPESVKVWGKGWYPGYEKAMESHPAAVTNLFRAMGADPDSDDGLRPEIHENIKAAGYTGVALAHGMEGDAPRVFLYPGQAKQASDQAMDAEWDESKHPRGPGGQFGTGGHAAKPKAEGGKPKASHHGGPNATPQKPFAKLDVGKLMKAGEKLGSNEGGTYEGKGGEKYYVKKPKSAAHVTNENTAARLYQLAGSNTLEYMDAGPNHVATKLEKLDKNNVIKLSPEEKRAAQKDFVTHAWLGNWDAAGLGGDNQGVLNGKVTTLDVGGSLEFRAQGQPKGAAFGNKVIELTTLLDANTNPDTAKLFGDMDLDQMEESVKQVVEIPNDAIREVVKAGGGSDELAEKLIARKEYIADYFAVEAAGDTNPEWEALHPRGPGGKFAAKPGGEEEGEEPALEPEDFDQFKFVVNEAFNGNDMDQVVQFASEYPDWAEELAQKTHNPKLSHHLDKGINKAHGGGEEHDPTEIMTTEQYLESQKGLGGNEPSPTPKFKTKKELVGHLLQQKDGVTMAEVLKQTGWPSVSMPAQAAAAGLKIEKKKVGGETKYFGTPMTAAEKADLKGKAKGKLAQKEAAAPATTFTPAAELEKQEAKPAPPAPAPTVGQMQAYKPTESELQKAKKSAALKMEYIPGEKPTNEHTGATIAAKELIKKFNEEWEGKENLADADLIKKVQQFKAIQTAVESLAQAEKQELKVNQEKIAAAAQEAAKQKKAAEAKKYGELMQDEGFKALAGLFGNNPAKAQQYMNEGAHYITKMKQHGVDLSPVDAGLIRSYIGSHYDKMNEQSYANALEPAQWAYRVALQKTMEKMPKFQGNVVRGIKNITAAQFAAYKPGMVVPSAAFASAGKKGKLWGNYEMHIESKTARDLSALNSEGGGEVVFLPGTGFHIISNNGKVAVVKEI